jgi:hypothetical protein
MFFFITCRRHSSTRFTISSMTVLMTPQVRIINNWLRWNWKLCINKRMLNVGYLFTQSWMKDQMVCNFRNSMGFKILKGENIFIKTTSLEI